MHDHSAGSVLYILQKILEAEKVHNKQATSLNSAVDDAKKVNSEDGDGERGTEMDDIKALTHLFILHLSRYDVCALYLM